MVTMGLKNCMLAWIFTLATTLGSAHADDISKGMRGPTNWQIDGQAFYLKRPSGLEALTNTFILKYWDGKTSGKWGFVIAPYKFTNGPDGSSNGTMDITLGGGPRFSTSNLHFLPYFALTLPTGELGNQRHDEKIGLLATYLTSNKKFEVDIAAQYTFTGKDKEGINQSNELYVGLVLGGKITDKIRSVAGFTAQRKGNGDYLLDIKSIMRYTFSKNVHVELVGETSVANRNILKKKDVGLQFRWNF